MFVERELSYIPWFDSDRFRIKVILGSKDIYYNLDAEYNIRGSHWSVTITTENELVLIQNRKLVIGVNLFENCYARAKPNCFLFPLTDDDRITAISRDNMINGNVRLFQVLPSDIGV
jgi:hypothetical protein